MSPSDADGPKERAAEAEAQLASASPPALVLDAANVGARTFQDIAAKARARKVRVLVPAPSLVEYATHEHRKHTTAVSKGTRVGPYDASLVLNKLRDEGVEIVALDEAQAMRAAARLVAWYPTDGAWQTAKQARLGKTDAPATIDWVVAAMCPDDAVLVSGDRGAEFQKLTRLDPKRVLEILKSRSG